MELVVGLDDVAVAPAVRRRHQQAEADVRAADAARRLDVFGDVGRQSGEEHRVELVDVDAVADGGGGDDVAQGSRRAAETPAAGATLSARSHHVLDFGDRHAARNQVGHERAGRAMPSARWSRSTCGLSVSMIWSPPFLLVT